jgi:hypothetical protein
MPQAAPPGRRRAEIRNTTGANRHAADHSLRESDTLHAIRTDFQAVRFMSFGILAGNYPLDFTKGLCIAVWTGIAEPFGLTI